MNNETKQCPYCCEEINIAAKKCKYCGEWLDKSTKSCSSCKEPLPKKYQRFNWGAFLLGWIWGIGNKTYITFLPFAFVFLSWIFSIPMYTFPEDTSLVAICLIFTLIIYFASLGFQIWFGVKGNEWAWQNKEWKSLEQFNEVQRKWAMWAAIINIGIPFVICIFSIFIILLAVIIAQS